MQLLTHKNHFQFGYNGQYFNSRASSNDVWNVRYGAVEDLTKVGNFREECIRAAKLIQADFKGQTIWLLFSGGVDSEVMVRSFVAAEVPFEVAIMRFKNDLNKHDHEWAEKICNELNITPTFFDLDVKEFILSDTATKIAEQVRSPFPEMLPTMWLMDQVNGVPVMGSGECFLVKTVPGDYRPGYHQYWKTDWYLNEKESIAAWYRFLWLNNKPGVAGFFQYTPELMLSFMLDPFVQDLINDRKIGKLTSLSSKFEILSQHFPLEYRPKYTGYEHLYEFVEPIKDELHKLYDDTRQIYRTETKALIRMLKGEE